MISNNCCYKYADITIGSFRLSYRLFLASSSTTRFFLLAIFGRLDRHVGGRGFRGKILTRGRSILGWNWTDRLASFAFFRLLLWFFLKIIDRCLQKYFFRIIEPEFFPKVLQQWCRLLQGFHNRVKVQYQGWRRSKFHFWTNFSWDPMVFRHSKWS